MLLLFVPASYIFTVCILDLLCFLFPKIKIQRSGVQDPLFNYLVSLFNLFVATTTIISFKDYIIAYPDIRNTFNILNIFRSLILADFFFYWSHRMMHIPVIYKAIHKFHHYHKSPSSASGLYVHPGEFLVDLIFIFILPVFITRLNEMEALIVWSLLIQNLAYSHSGIKYLSEYHDLHHSSTPKRRFGSEWGVWDTIFGTD